MSGLVATAGHKISDFFHSLLVFFLDNIHRAINTFSNNKRPTSTYSTTGPRDQPGADKMAAPAPANKPLSTRIVPALPLLPPRAPRAENVPPPKEPLADVNILSQQGKSESRVVDGMSRLVLSTAPQSGMPKISSLPVDGVTGENAVHAGFMREALDMVRHSLLPMASPNPFPPQPGLELELLFEYVVS